MVYRYFNPKMLILFGFLSIISFFMASLVGVIIITQTTSQTTDIAGEQFYQTAQTEITTLTQAEAAKFESYFGSFEEDICIMQGYIHEALNHSANDTRWKSIEQGPGGEWGLFSDVGIGEIYLPNFITLNSSVNATIQTFSDIGRYFQPLTDSETVLQAYLGTENGLIRFFPYSNIINNNPSPSFDPRQRIWYQGAKLSNATYWSVYEDFTTKSLIATISIPFYNNSELFGIVALDMSLDYINEVISKFHYKDSSYALLISNDTLEILAKPSLLEVDLAYDEIYFSDNLTAVNNPNLASNLNYIKGNSNGSFVISVKSGLTLTTNTSKLIFFQHINRPSLIIISVIQEAEIHKLAYEIAQIWNESAGRYILGSMLLGFFIIILVFIIAFFLLGISIWRYSLPIERVLSENRRADVLFNIIGHDLRNALQSHIFVLEMLEKELGNEDVKSRAFLPTNTTYQKIERIGRVVHQIGELRFLNEEYVRKNPLDLSVLCQNMVDDLKNQFISSNDEDITVQFVNNTSRILKTSYNPLLQSALTEIGSNGILYHKKDKKDDKDKKELKIVLDNIENKFALIQIIDNGSGISPNIREILLEPLKYISLRTGLGYVILNLATELSGGRYEIRFNDSKTKMGTKVLIYLPLLDY